MSIAVWRVRGLLLALIGGVSVAMLSAGAYAAPAAAACQPPTAPIPESQRKFHPGHYVSIGRAGARNGINPAMGKGVAGVQLRYRWADLEPEQDRYDFSAIERDLAAVTRAGIQLVAFIEDKSFTEAQPTPAYLQSKYTLRNRQRGYTAMRWEPYVNDRLKQLVARLGAQFDCNPHFEGIAFQETAPSLDDDQLVGKGYTPEKYRDALTGLLRSASVSLPRSRVFWYMNFLPGNQGYLGEIATSVIGTGVVMGGPDILPDNPSLARRVYPIYDKFQGRLKLFSSMQHNSFRHRRGGGAGGEYWTMEDLFVYARDKLHVNYIFWDYHVKRQPADSRDFTEAREVIARHPAFDPASPR